MPPPSPQITWSPQSGDQALDAVRTALDADRRLEIVGAGSRRGFGRPVDADVVLDLSGLGRVVDYQPEELVLTVEPGAKVAEVEALLAQRGQQLAFEPPDPGPLWGLARGAGTIGGCVMTGRGGPRRLAAGAPRDHFLGVKGINGFGEAFAAGGRVVKNVTGFDVTKLVAGSFGTLCVVTEMTLKVLPAPPDELTLAIRGLADTAGVAALSRALATPAAVTGAAHLPAAVASEGVAMTLLRLEGVTPSIAARATRLAADLADFGPVERLAGDAARELWRAIGDASLFTGGDELVWQLSLPPTAAVGVAEALGGRCVYDWGGGAVWIALPPAEDAHAGRVRAALRAAVGHDGHATLMRAPEAVRRAVPPFEPPTPAVAALTQRVKRQFDPRGLFNPGRMYEGV